MENITIPLQIPNDLRLALNSSEIELKNDFQLTISIFLYQRFL